jgi:hypothetical protein
MEPKHSALGITSFVLSLLVGLLVFGVMVVAGILEARRPGGMPEDSPVTILVGLVIIGAMMLDLLAVVLGIVGLVQKDTKKVFAILGLIISALTLFGTIGLIIIGNMIK